jgi:hypothetical protein
MKKQNKEGKGENKEEKISTVGVHGIYIEWQRVKLTGHYTERTNIQHFEGQHTIPCSFLQVSRLWYREHDKWALKTQFFFSFIIIWAVTAQSV